MNKPIIADSSGLVSLITETDHNHGIALNITAELKGAKGLVIVPGDVFSETLNVVSLKSGRGAALKTAQYIFESQTYLVFDTNDQIRKSALEVFEKQPQSVSFTDCVVMAFADQFQTKDIFGFDEVFKKNGYHRLDFDR